MTEGHKAPVTVLGLGPMGRALAGAFLDNGHPTTVWNRTAAKADALVARGAVRAATVEEAVGASELVVLCVIDYAAGREIVEPVAGALGGRGLVHLTADTPERARRMAAWAAEHGIDYLDGAIMTPTETIGGPGAVLLYSGPEALYRKHREALDSLGGSASYLGADPGRAAAHDVALLDMCWTAVTGLAHGFALAAAEDITARELAPFAEGIAQLLPHFITEMVKDTEAGEFPGETSNIRSITAGMEHVREASEARGIDGGVIAAALRVAHRAIDAGRGEDNITGLVNHMSPRRAGGSRRE
ncbi:NAD(P)-dependent oxidoreductase [Pseudonocardia acaciae]|uniref:NAD(P)-dependent oxidoreductase n=1 Tax=Pseudonocardia acaciae TaxID=551276 RepID=UPI000686D496|nr:NAD(P)-binding domain-containing protein [Pseudonocardia acaciae]